MNIGPEGLQYRISGRFLRVGGRAALETEGCRAGRSPWKTSFTANVVAHAPKKRNAPVELSGILPSTLEEPARQRARELVNTPEFAKAQRERKKVEARFAELKNQIGLRRLRGLKFVREQFFMTAAAQNIKRLVRFLSQAAKPPLPARRREQNHRPMALTLGRRGTQWRKAGTRFGKTGANG
jgi:hypothetical protein